MTAHARPLGRSTGKATSFIVLLLPLNQVVFASIHHYCLTVRGRPNSFPPSVPLCTRGTWNNNVPQCPAFHVKQGFNGALLLQLFAACFQDLDGSCHYFGRSILGRCIIDGLCFYCGSLINIYGDLGEGERVHRGWISIFTDSSSSAVFLVPLQPFSAETSTPRCNTSVSFGSWLMGSVLIVVCK